MKENVVDMKQYKRGKLMAASFYAACQKNLDLKPGEVPPLEKLKEVR